MMKILFAASEAVPFMKTGGLADVTGSLPGYFDKKHFDVRIIMPKYLCMDEKWKAQLRFVCHFYVNLSWRRQYVGIFETVQNGITYYFVDNEFYFAGDKPYHNIYEDVEKFAMKKSKAYRSGPWQTDFDEMAKKTVLKKVLKYAPLKTEFARAVATDETVKSTLSDNMADEPNEVLTTIDNEPEAAPEEAPQGVNTETGEVKE